MKLLVLGSGGREHALVWKLRQSPRVSAIFCAPGNAGIARDATPVPIGINDHPALVQFAKEQGIDFTIVGPDEALAAGIVDSFQAASLRIFGPTRKAAQFEASKAFAKEFMLRHGIPTARAATFEESGAAHRYCQKLQYPIVLKADGLALGKGVVIARAPWDAALAIYQIMERRIFGDAGRRIVVEEFLEGEECSVHALVDGRSYLLFPAAQDHKQAFDGDQGPNTGGMGAFSPPAHLLTRELEARVRVEILDRFLAGLQKEGIDFRGMLFPGLMITREGPKVLEFNCRFGDPETQVLVTRLESDLLDLLEATVDAQLADAQPRWSNQPAVCVVLASAGYPGPCQTGRAITGLDTISPGVMIFHAGTKSEDDRCLTSGGRVLGVTALGPDLQSARHRAYDAVEKIDFPGCHFRRDIAAKGLRP